MADIPTSEASSKAVLNPLHPSIEAMVDEKVKAIYNEHQGK